MNLVDFLLENSNVLTKTCVLGRNEDTSFQSLSKKVHSLALKLFETYGTGNEILLLSENSLFFIVAYLSIIKSGNTAVVLDTKISEKDLSYILHECSIKVHFIQKKFLSRFDKPDPFFDEFSYSTWASSESSGSFESENNDDDIAVILFTSGSTGTKKGVMLTHKNIISNTDSIVQYLGLTANDRIYVVLPFSYTFGASLLHTHLRVGGSLVLGNPIFIGAIPREIDHYHCTGFAGVPSTFQILIHKTDFLHQKFSNLRYFQQAGGHLAEKYKLMILDAFPDISFFAMYGLTEATARCTYLHPDKIRTKINSLGQGIPGVHVEVLGPDGVPIQPGDIGEITIFGNNVMKGYYHDPEGTGEVLRNGRLYTGDMATIDEDGDIFFVERGKNFIKSGGFRISPIEIEDIISSVDGVEGCVVVGMPDELLGESVAAFVPLEKESTEDKVQEDIISMCSKKLATHKIPRKIIFLNEIPLNSSLKYDRTKLKQIMKEMM